MIGKIYIKWQETPVIVSFAETSTPVWQIPFPAVTICPETKVSKEELDFSEAFRKLKTLKNNQTIKDILNLVDREKFEALAQVCDLHLLKNRKFDNILQPRNLIPLLKKIQIYQNDSILFCTWNDNGTRDCAEYFDEILTEEGSCHTFNILDSGELYKKEKLVQWFNG